MLDSEQPHLSAEHALARRAITALQCHRLSLATYAAVLAASFRAPPLVQTVPQQSELGVYFPVITIL